MFVHKTSQRLLNGLRYLQMHGLWINATRTRALVLMQPSLTPDGPPPSQRLVHGDEADTFQLHVNCVAVACHNNSIAELGFLVDYRHCKGCNIYFNAALLLHELHSRCRLNCGPMSCEYVLQTS